MGSQFVPASRFTADTALPIIGHPLHMGETGQPEAMSRFDFRAHFEESGLLRSAVEGAHIGLWSTDLTTGLTDCTRLMFALLDLDPNRPPLDVAGWRQVIHPDYFDELVAGWAAAALTHAVYEGEYRNVLPDGEVRWLFSSGRRLS